MRDYLLLQGVRVTPHPADGGTEMPFLSRLVELQRGKTHAPGSIPRRERHQRSCGKSLSADPGRSPLPRRQGGLTDLPAAPAPAAAAARRRALRPDTSTRALPAAEPTFARTLRPPAPPAPRWGRGEAVGSTPPAHGESRKLSARLRARRRTLRAGRCGPPPLRAPR